MRKVGTGVILLGAIALVLAGAARNSDIYFLIKKNFTIFSEVYKEVSVNYVDEVDPERLMRQGIDAMLETLDPYTVFIDEAQNQDLEIMTRGSYGGVGLDVGVKGDQTVVIAPLDGSPAQKKGIRSGDVIKEINGISVEEMTPEEVQNITIGEPGTTVVVIIERFGVDQPLQFELERERIEVKNITYHGLIGTDNDIGYILLNRFAQNADQEVRKVLTTMEEEDELRGLVLDLRNNPGGLLDEAVGIVDKFIEPGLDVVETRGRISRHNNTFRTEEPALIEDLPMVVLQNSGSASASEIVAGALQDYDRAVVIGEQSFGKGLVQVLHPLPYNTALKMTASRYYIPSGRSIQSVIYTHDEENSERSLPDSLRRAFKTQNGRTVFDGQGIIPDLNVAQKTPSLLETALMQQSQFFYFANRYASENDRFEENQVSDQLFSEFQQFLNENNFEYETQAQNALAELKNHIVEQGTDNDIAAHIQALQKKIEQQKEQDFSDEHEDLKRYLYLELISRFQGREGQTKASLKFDPVVEEALSVLYSQELYNEILGYN